MTNQITTTVAATPQKKEDTVQMAFEKMKGQFARVLPNHITPERLCRVALNACQSTPKLLQCERKSLLSAVMRAAQLGLEPDGVLGQAYLIPFNKNTYVDGKWVKTAEVQFIVGYKGLIDLARRSGDVSNLIAKEVYENDEFSIDWSQEIPFVHKPKMDGDRGEVTHFWAMARFKDGGFHWDYMTRQEVESIRNNSQGYKSADTDKKKEDSVWGKYFIEMGKKTIIRRIAKYLPMSVQKAGLTEDLAEAGKSFHIDDFGDIVIDGEAEEIPQDAPKLGNEAVKEKLAKKAKAAGADTETGELPKEESPVFNPADFVEFNAKAIPMKSVVGDATQPDFSGWKLSFFSGCNSAPTLEELKLFYKNNSHILKQMETRAKEIFAECEACYNDNIARLDIGE